MLFLARWTLDGIELDRGEHEDVRIHCETSVNELSGCRAFDENSIHDRDAYRGAAVKTCWSVDLSRRLANEAGTVFYALRGFP